MKTHDLTCNFNWKQLSSAEADLKKLSKKTLMKILFQTYLIHHFEMEVLRLKNNDCVWGPVHSSVGQEAIASATIAALRKEDKITGSHRAHHQFLAKALNFVLDEKWDPERDELSAQAREVVRKTLAEIMGLAPGYCGGRGGSMHLRYEEAGILGTNAIVAGGIPLATGAAYAEKWKKHGSIIACFFGDGAVNQGSFHEALNLAGLWDLPIVYIIENNQYAVATNAKDAAAVDDLSIRAAGYDLDGWIVEGDDVAALYRTVEKAAENARNKSKPSIVEIKCYRHYHHAGDKPGSAFGYRDKAEESGWLERDPLVTLPVILQKAGIIAEEKIEMIRKKAEQAVDDAVDFCTVGEDRCGVREELWPDPSTASFGLRSNGEELQNLSYAEPEDFQEHDEIKFSDAIAAVTGRWMEKDQSVVEFGEEVANFGGGAYGATKGLPARFPGRIVNTPISEAGFVGLSCGAAMAGMRPIVEIMFPDFTLVAADQVFNQIAKARHMYGGTTDLPLVARTRIATGNGYGGQHSMDPIGLFALFAGWRIVAPSNAFDYIGLFNTAMTSLDPVLFLEHHSLYTKKFQIPKDSLDYAVPFGKARVVQEGTDITVITYSSLTGRIGDLAGEFEKRGVSLELIDLRTVDLPSIDYETIGASVVKTGAVVVIEEAAAGQAIGDRINHQITERFFDALDGPPGWITSLNVPTSVSKVLEEAALISDDEILERTTAIAERRGM